MNKKNFRRWKSDKTYLKRRKEKRQLVFKIACVVAFILGIYHSSYVFNSTVEPYISSYKQEEEKDHPKEFSSYGQYERLFKQSNSHLFK